MFIRQLSRSVIGPATARDLDFHLLIENVAYTFIIVGGYGKRLDKGCKVTASENTFLMGFLMQARRNGD